MVLKMISNGINKPNPTHRKKQYNCEGMTGNTPGHTHTFKHKDTGGMRSATETLQYVVCTSPILHGQGTSRVSLKSSGFYME